MHVGVGVGAGAGAVVVVRVVGVVLRFGDAAEGVRADLLERGGEVVEDEGVAEAFEY